MTANRHAKAANGFECQDVRTALERRQFEFRRQKGNHMILGRSEPAGRVVVPDHKQVRVGTLRKIISQAGLTVEDFLKALAGD